MYVDKINVVHSNSYDPCNCESIINSMHAFNTTCTYQFSLVEGELLKMQVHVHRQKGHVSVWWHHCY